MSDLAVAAAVPPRSRRVAGRETTCAPPRACCAADDNRPSMFPFGQQSPISNILAEESFADRRPVGGCLAGHEVKPEERFANIRICPESHLGGGTRVITKSVQCIAHCAI
jgi:hypothetical protein